MDLRLKGRTAVITGATRGIGRAIAETFADQGANVAICARTKDDVHKTVEALETKGVRALGAAVDVRNQRSLADFIRHTASTFGGIDVLVSNATAMTLVGSTDWKAMFEVDLMGSVNAFDAAEPYLAKAGSTHGDAAFIMISSVSAAEIYMGASPYGSMKAALIHYAKGLARDYAVSHIRTNVVSPGPVYIDGGFWSQIQIHAPALFEDMIKNSPTGRLATPQEIADAVAFLSSPRSSFTTGINMVVDGGISRRVNF